MVNLRNIIHDLMAPVRVLLEGERTFQGVKFKYFANGLGTFRSINTNEPRSVEFASNLQDLGVNSFLDIGSSFGVWSLPFLKKAETSGYQSRVLAIDAHSLSCHDLYRNAKFNGLSSQRLSIINAAVGTENGYTVLHFPKYASNLGSTGSKNATRRLFNQQIAIPVVDVSFFTNSFMPELVKIDVEGLDLILAKRIVDSNQTLKVLSVEITPTNLLSGGSDLLKVIANDFPYLIPIPKEAENNQIHLRIETVEEAISISNRTRKTNLFFFRDKSLATEALSLLHHENH